MPLLLILRVLLARATAMLARAGLVRFGQARAGFSKRVGQTSGSGPRRARAYREDLEKGWEGRFGSQAQDGPGWESRLGSQARDGVGWGSRLGSQARDGPGWGSRLGSQARDGPGWGSRLGSQGRDGPGWGSRLGSQGRDGPGWESRLGSQGRDGPEWGSRLGSQGRDGLGWESRLGRVGMPEQTEELKHGNRGGAQGALIACLLCLLDPKGNVREDQDEERSCAFVDRRRGFEDPLWRDQQNVEYLDDGFPHIRNDIDIVKRCPKGNYLKEEHDAPQLTRPRLPPKPPLSLPSRFTYCTSPPPLLPPRPYPSTQGGTQTVMSTFGKEDGASACCGQTRSWKTDSFGQRPSNKTERAFTREGLLLSNTDKPHSHAFPRDNSLAKENYLQTIEDAEQQATLHDLHGACFMRPHVPEVQNVVNPWLNSSMPGYMDITMAELELSASGGDHSNNCPLRPEGDRCQWSYGGFPRTPTEKCMLRTEATLTSEDSCQRGFVSDGKRLVPKTEDIGGKRGVPGARRTLLPALRAAATVGAQRRPGALRDMS